MPPAPPKTGIMPPVPPAAPVIPRSLPPSAAPPVSSASPPVFSPASTQKTFRQIPPPPPPPSRTAAVPAQEKTLPAFAAPKNAMPSAHESQGVILEHVMPKFPPVGELSLSPPMASPPITSPRPLQTTPATAEPALPQPVAPDAHFLPAPPVDLRSQQRPPAYKTEPPPSVPLMDPRTSLDLRPLTRPPAEVTAPQMQPAPLKHSSPLQQTPSPSPKPPAQIMIEDGQESIKPPPSFTKPDSLTSTPPRPIPSPTPAAHLPSPTPVTRPSQLSRPPTGGSASANDPYREPVEE